VLRQIRDADDVDSSIDVDLPVLVCSGRSDDLARLRGFDAGCDDYSPSVVVGAASGQRAIERLPRLDPHADHVIGRRLSRRAALHSSQTPPKCGTCHTWPLASS